MKRDIGLYLEEEKYPNILWKNIAGTRDVLIHDYVDINLIRVWNIIQKDLKPLKLQIQNLLQEFDKR